MFWHITTSVDLAAKYLSASLMGVVIHTIPLGYTSQWAPVLTYHACFPDCPPNVAPVDNITPDQLYQQISFMKRHYRFVTIDELCRARTREGLAALTFDDGYQSVLEYALPVLAALDVPFTIFVNTAFLEQKMFWRHKVVFILQNGLLEECQRHFVHTRRFSKDFYRDLKDPRNNSRLVEEEIDNFLSSRGLHLEGNGYLFNDISCLRPHPLVWYGNHSHHHYVLSSLSRNEQMEEIGKTKALLEQIPEIQISDVFSLPFGETHHANDDTFTAARDLGYRSLLMNRGRLNTSQNTSHDGLSVIERFSPAGGRLDVQLKKQLCKTVGSVLWR